MQAEQHRGWEDLLRHYVIPSLTLQDLQSLSACCRGFSALVEALPQRTWTRVARWVVQTLSSEDTITSELALAHELCAAGTPFQKSTLCAVLSLERLWPIEQAVLPGCIKACRLAQPQSRV